MMPVLSDMMKAIEDHLTSHNEHSTPKHGHIQRPRASFLSENLAEQVLVRAAEIGGTLSREPTIALPDTDTET